MTEPTRSGVVAERWVPEPRPADGPDGRGESGDERDLATRRETEEAAMTGRFPDGGEVRDDSNPIEPEEPASFERESYPIEQEQPGVVSGGREPHSHDTNPGQPSEGLDRGVAAEHLRSESQGARPERIDRTTEDDAAG